MNLTTILQDATSQIASDVHLVGGEPPVFRVGGKLERQTNQSPLTAADLTDGLLPLLTESARLGLEDGSLSAADAIVSVPENPQLFTLKVFRSLGGFAANLRALRSEIPTLEQVGGDAMDQLREIAALRRGFVIFSGPTGSGKQTTASSVVDHINRTRGERIYVVEELPGYQWTNHKSLVTTLQVGADYGSYDHVTRTLLHGADPDVVLFNDLPTVDAVRQAVTLADNGNLVIAVIHADSAAAALAQIARSLPEPHDTSRAALARVVHAVFGQRLLPRVEGTGRVPLYEYVFTSPELTAILASSAGETDLNSLQQRDTEHARSRAAARARLVAQGLVGGE